MFFAILGNTMAQLSEDDILKLARLSKLDLTDEQVQQYKKEIADIVNFVEQLQSVDVAGLEPTNQVTGLVNVTRPDEIKEYAQPQELLKNLPNREDDLIKVKRMIG